MAASPPGRKRTERRGRCAAMPSKNGSASSSRADNGASANRSRSRCRAFLGGDNAAKLVNAVPARRRSRPSASVRRRPASRRHRSPGRASQRRRCAAPTQISPGRSESITQRSADCGPNNRATRVMARIVPISRGHSGIRSAVRFKCEALASGFTASRADRAALNLSGDCVNSGASAPFFSANWRALAPTIAISARFSRFCYSCRMLN